MEKLQSIQVLRGLAVLGVVLFHCLSIESKYFAGAKVLPKVFELGQSGVDLFFVISGFVMVTVTKGRHGLPFESWRFLWARLTRIYPTYWFYFLLTAGIFSIRPDWVNASQGHQVDFFSSFFLLPSNRLPLVMVAWSLIHELWFYLVFALFIAFPERILLPLLLAWAFVVIAANFIFVNFNLAPIVQITLHPYTIEFIIGALSALVSLRIHRVLTKLKLTVALIIVFAGLIIAAHFGIFNQPNMLRAVFFGLLYGFAMAVVVIAERTDLLRVPSLLLVFGNASYTIYLSHLLVLSAAGRLWSMWFPVDANRVTIIVIFSAMLGLVAIYGWLAYRFVELPVLQLSRQLRTLWFDGHEKKYACANSAGTSR